jgi:hypothetical protein
VPKNSAINALGLRAANFSLIVNFLPPVFAAAVATVVAVLAGFLVAGRFFGAAFDEEAFFVAITLPPYKLTFLIIAQSFQKWYNVLMAIIFNKTDHQSELQRRITSELRAKQAGKSLDTELRAPEYDNETSTYLKNTKQTTSLAWAWTLIAVAVVGIIIAIIVVLS